jgi:putative DNA primase/helicase
MASSVKPRLVEWLWPYRIPLGDLTAFAGNCDVGKSTVVADVVARVTLGKEWPDGPNTFGPADVLMCIAEGSKDKDIVPLLMAAGADLGRVHLYKQMTPTDPTKAKARRIALNSDLDHVGKYLEANPRIKLIVFDPLTGYLGVKKNDEVAIRSVLEPLGELADRFGVAVLSVDHFNKNLDQAAVNRVSGSQALTDVPRAVWAFVKKKAEEGAPATNERSMVSIKGNLAPEDKKMGQDYAIVGKPITVEEKEISFRGIEWLGKSTQTADAAVAGVPRESDVVRWLREFLSHGEQLSNDVYEKGAAAGYTSKQVYGARRKLGVLVRKGTASEGSRTYLGLPVDEACEVA